MLFHAIALNCIAEIAISSQFLEICRMHYPIGIDVFHHNTWDGKKEAMNAVLSFLNS